jgi:hypothetical protein
MGYWKWLGRNIIMILIFVIVGIFLTIKKLRYEQRYAIVCIIVFFVMFMPLVLFELVPLIEFTIAIMAFIIPTLIFFYGYYKDVVEE